MKKRRLVYLYILLGILIFSLFISKIQSITGQTNRSEERLKKLSESIVREFGSVRRNDKDRFIVLIDSHDVRRFLGPLDPTQATIRACWFSHLGSLKSCTPQSFLEVYQSTPQVRMKYSYAIFMITNTDPTYTRATIRLDMDFGPKSETGYWLIMRWDKDRWKIESRQTAFVT